MASSMVPTLMNAVSGYGSISPSMIILNPRIVSAMETITPGCPVYCSAMKKGCERNRCTLRARFTVRRSSSESSSMPRMEMMSCSSL